MSSEEYDVVIVGSGPNGLAAGIVLARAGWRTLILERAETPGGGMRTEELTLPGFHHDVCSAVHPMARVSPVFRQWDLESEGLTFLDPEYPVGHPLDDEPFVFQHRDLEETAERLGRDGSGYRRLYQPFLRGAEALFETVLGPKRLPKDPWTLGRFGMVALRSAQSVAETAYGEERAKALFAGHAAHSVLSLRQAGTGAFGLILGISGHSVGWPVVRGGSAEIAHALVALFERAGGTLVCQAAIEEVGDLPSAKAYVYDTSPRALLALYEELFPPGYRNALQGYQWGPGVCKVDWALSDPIPWRDPEASKTATLHLGGTLAEVSESEDACLQGRMVERPFVLLSQPSLVDEGRAPEGKHTAWAYCHVPHGYDRDVTDLIAAQVERFAPGFRETILAAHTMTAPAMARYNPNYVGGDVVGGQQTLWQQVARPALRWDPYQTPLPGVYLCSASTPPGPGVHGMCGARAADSVMRWLETRGHLPL